jgi:hypothetical protein|tara:strand:- start:384 stop:1013 length:630 start_codon:yes stop_codon:yes gene_type:complete
LLKAQKDFIHSAIAKDPEYNSSGFRMRKEISEIDFDNYIIFAGSSHTTGVGVKYEEMFSHLVSAVMKVDCVNLALGGGGIDAVEHNLLVWHLKYKQPPKAIVVEWPIYQRYIKHIEHQENLCPAGNWSDPKFVTYADIPLYVKGEMVFKQLHRLIPTKIIDVTHGKISKYTWNSSMIWHNSIDKGTDGEHAGPKSHLNTAEQILSALGY